MAKKRGQNEGSIYKRSDGLWTAQVTVQEKRLTKYCKTQKECREWIKAQQAQMDNGVDLLAAQITVEKFMDEFLQAHTVSVRPSTIIQYRQIFNQHINPFIGHMKLKDLRPDQVQSLYNKKLKSGCSNQTVLLIHSVLHRALNHALRMGLVGRNAADAVSKPRQYRKEMHTLDDNQVRTLLLASEESRYSMLFYMAVTTGLRQGELFGLKWSDLDWKSRKLRVQRQIKRIAGQGAVFTEPKTKAGRRQVVLSPAAIERLCKHYQRQQLERQFAGDKWQEMDLIFPSSIGTPMDTHNMRKEFKEILANAGLPDIRFHDLRHTAATLMLQQNVHPKVVQERLGHSDISLTLNTYSHVLPGMQEEADEKLDELLTPIDISKDLNVK